MSEDAASLHTAIKACTLCAEHLPLGPRPVVQFSETSRILIIGQAPGTKVHKSGIPWDDDSGDRLREWLQIDKADFYNPAQIALVPMGFCYPGKAKGGDQPPRPECAPKWHDRVLDTLPKDRLTLLLGAYAQKAYMSNTSKLTMADRIRAWAECNEANSTLIPLPHPAWRSRLFMAKHTWFEDKALPRLRSAVDAVLAR
ncbi:uracil-DNA glycosylase family protein [Erythrobacter sp. YT30]|uniref:uracil-DNA glycosylase family protein n=1 Tax=Erythrobacter sp. YT30 TaxID=1735012 RepID=UPI00076C0F97|nr:uracil-DNA glycosylase family protein [Erythrobacter sp. YT30]KWV92636.1 IclR family transcriptional regulator [Erythrobacter sp. YT30]